MSIQIRESGDFIFVTFTDSRILDETKIQENGSRLMSLIDEHSAKRMCLDFRNVSFMSSGMLGKIILFAKKCRSSNIELRLCEIDPAIMEVFKLMNLNQSLVQKSCEKDGPELLGAPVPLRKAPSSDSGRAKPPQD